MSSIFSKVCSVKLMEQKVVIHDTFPLHITTMIMSNNLHLESFSTFDEERDDTDFPLVALQ